MEIGDGTFEVLSTDGNAFLGGKDFDQRILDFLADDFKSQYGIDLKNDSMAMQRLMDAAENAKKELSSSNETDINLPFITADASGPKHLVTKLTRSKFEAMIEDLAEETVSHITTALKDAGMSPNDIDEVVMVGGSIRIPLIQEKVSKYFGGKTLNKSVNPDEVVAAGAAIQGGVLRGDVKDVLLLDVTPLSLGIETLGGVMTRLIEKGTTIPVKKSQTFSTAEDNQSAVTVHILQGEREFANDNKSLGRFNLEGIPAMRRGEPQIEISLDIDANGVLNVSAKEKTTGKEQTITISGSSGLSDAEIEKMIKDAEAHKAEDMKRKEIVDKRNELDAMISMCEKEGFTGSELEAAKSSVKEINSTKEDLENALSTLSQAYQTFMQSKASENVSESKKDDDVIDAEIE